jgi:pentatricopeptide repeat-containing protein PET309
MLERTAGCLESGSLRRLLPASKRSLKSRRTLHSGFWTHGASDLELSPLWAALIRATYTGEQQGEVLSQHRLSSGHGSMLMEFLYPARTINFLRQYSGWGVDRQDGRWARAGLAKLGHRQYTSSAKDKSPAEETTSLGTTKRSEQIDPGVEGMARLYQRMGLSKSYDYEEAWRQFELLDGDDQHQFRKPLFQYLTASDRIIDAERMIELFEMMTEEQKDIMVYRYTIRAYLKLRNLFDAMRLYNLALQNLEVPAGSEELLAYLVTNSLWSRAASLWEDVDAFQSSSTHGKYNIWEVINNLAHVGNQAMALADHVNKRIAASSADAPTDISRLKHFASRIIRRALLNSVEFIPARFQSLLGSLQQWELDTPQFYEDAFQLLFQQNEGKLAVSCYRKARQKDHIQFTRPTLHSLLEIFCDQHSVLGMQEVLDDFFRAYSRPTRRAYQMCMTEFAAQGDARTVHALFEQYATRFVQDGGVRLQSGNDMAPLLNVHAVRGELREVIRLFNEMQNEYGVQPTLLCWNILISAYGKAHDIDGAFECFEQLLESPDPYLKPDHYTFGTMMGICTTRGDLDRAIQLYTLANELNIDKSAAMLDTLVLAYTQGEDFEKAEKICEDGIDMELIGSRTRMWNHLLVAYSLRRDLNNVNRLLQKMSQANVDYDQYTYAALMQSLAIVKQPDKAWAILRTVMPEAGYIPTPFHYAIVMGGYLATRETHKLIDVQRRMTRHLRSTASTNLLTLKGTAVEDQKLMDKGLEEQTLQRTFQLFQDIISSMDPQDISHTARKGVGRHPLDVAYTTMFYNYIMFILAQQGQSQAVEDLYEDFRRLVPEARRDSPPVEILSALIISKFREGDDEGVEACWQLALTQARKLGRPLPKVDFSKYTTVSNDTTTTEDEKVPNSVETEASPSIIVPVRQLELAEILMTYMRFLAKKERVDHLILTVNGLLQEGFFLDQGNWNFYIQILCRTFRYKLAFEICETRLMDNWAGWALIRRQLPVRNRLPIEVRNKKNWQRHLRPFHTTLLYLARAYLELEAMGAESRASQAFLSDLERDCPRIVKAIRTMQRTDDEVERSILRGW